MPVTFQNIYEDLMDTVNRPLTDTATVAKAKRAVNNAMLFLQRHHGFQYTERVAKVTYPAGAFMVNLTNVCGGLLRDIFSVQLLTDSGAFSGKNLKFYRYAQLQAQKKSMQERSTVDENEARYLTASLHEEFTTNVHGQIMFQVDDNLGLYPSPAENKYLLLHVHIWLPLLVDNSDTNFFLDYAYDIVFKIAMRELVRYLGDDQRALVDNSSLADDLATLVAWDGSISSGANTYDNG